MSIAAGALGTGWIERVAAALRACLDWLATPRCPVTGLKVSGAVWVLPDLRDEIAYRGTTTAGELRHASFKGLEEGDRSLSLKAGGRARRDDFVWTR